MNFLANPIASLVVNAKEKTENRIRAEKGRERVCVCRYVCVCVCIHSQGLVAGRPHCRDTRGV